MAAIRVATKITVELHSSVVDMWPYLSCFDGSPTEGSTIKPGSSTAISQQVSLLSVDAL